MRYTAKDLDTYLGKTITVSGKYLIDNKKFGHFRFSGKLIRYGYKKYAIEYPDRHNRYQIGTFPITGVKKIELGGSL